MEDLKKILPFHIYETLNRVGMLTTKEILILSTFDIKKKTHLKNADIKLLKELVADHIAPKPINCYLMSLNEDHHQKVTTGCDAIDEMLGGGLRKGTLTEIYGESGSGKTQLCLQAIAHNWSNGCVYINTEDLFPVKRFEQIKKSIPDYQEHSDYGKNIFIEHITEAKDLLACLRIRLPKLVDENDISLIVVDSVAGPFRSEYNNYIQRAEDLRELAISLISIAKKYRVAVLCVNQVTANISSGETLPALGLAWSNMVCTRLRLKKTDQIVNSTTDQIVHGAKTFEKSFVRELSVIFSPELANNKVCIAINLLGIQSL